MIRIKTPLQDFPKCVTDIIARKGLFSTEYRTYIGPISFEPIWIEIIDEIDMLAWIQDMSKTMIGYKKDIEVSYKDIVLHVVGTWPIKVEPKDSKGVQKVFLHIDKMTPKHVQGT